MTMDDYGYPEAVGPDVDWSEGGRVHNWRNYVGERTRLLWSTLTDEQRSAIAQDADEMASQEEWD